MVGVLAGLFGADSRPSIDQPPERWLGSHS
jgi:hypothetical protein